MRLSIPFLLAILVANIYSFASAQVVTPASGKEVIEIEGRRELFVDRLLIDKMQDARLVLNRPKDEGSVLKFDQPWEGPFSGYATVIKDGELFRLYYRGIPQVGSDGNSGEVCCYAESKDGIHWTKPKLDLFEVRGHKTNNVVLANAAPVTHNFCPMLDERPNIPSDERFKALGGTQASGLIAWASADGIDWRKLQESPVIAKDNVPFHSMLDSQNLAFWSPVEQTYLCYFRVNQDGIRRIARASSDDFLHWSNAELMEYRHNGGEAPLEHLYTNQTRPYFRAPHLSVAVAARFMPGRQVITEQQAKQIKVNPKYFKDTSDAILMTTRGGKVYDRTFLSSFVRPGIGMKNWVSRTNYPALGIVQTGPAEMSVYVNQDYAQPTSHLRRYSMRLDGFASVRAEYAGGELLTKPVVFSGNRLSINFATSAAGGIRVELQTQDGQPIPGFTLADCREQIGNEIERVVSWKGGEDVSKLAGKPIRLRFEMKDADLFAIQFVESEQSSSTIGTTPVLVESHRIWSEAPHNAFTDLVRFKGKWFCAFRQGKSHVSPDGAMRIISSSDGKRWESAALIESSTSDLRDAKLSITPDGQLMLAGAEAMDRPDPHKHQSLVWFSEDGANWSKKHEIGDPDNWLWRVTWHKGKAYGFGYGTRPDHRGLRLFESEDGKSFRTLIENVDVPGYPNETAMLFLPDDSCYCLLRRDGGDKMGTGLLGISQAPYTKWEWKDLGTRLGGPVMIQLPNGRFVAVVRLYDGGARTSLCWIDPEEGTITEALKLPSGGDTSYAGMVWYDGFLWISYYSSHEEKTSIYLAKVKFE